MSLLAISDCLSLSEGQTLIFKEVSDTDGGRHQSKEESPSRAVVNQDEVFTVLSKGFFP